MQNEHRAAIQKCFGSLVEQTDLDMMVSSLYEKGVFSEAMIEPYKDQTKEQRTRKRQLYMDITRRGPDAFGHLVEALREIGCWNIARELEPGSLPPRAEGSKSNDNVFVSIVEAKKKGTSNSAATENYPPAASPQPPQPPRDNTDKVPKFNVVKSTKFMEDNGKDIRLYRTRGRLRGVLVVFSYVEFAYNLEHDRKGVDVDCQKLKYLFSEFGFKVSSFLNLSKEETLSAMRHLQLQGAESVFIVVSSHGYQRAGTWETDIRCSDGALISTITVVDHFNNVNCPALVGIPKVFIFQMCRGSNGSMAMAPSVARDGAPFRDGPRLHAPAAPRSERVYSDILIAHSTLPGYVSNRDEYEGSWYIQVLCEVFAAYAHAAHVETLFTLVDQTLHKRFDVQTSDVQKWGFNSKLYLHPGLAEDSPPAARPAEREGRGSALH